MDCWPKQEMPVEAGYPPPEVQLYCVQDANWQHYRLRMKGEPTQKKLDMLSDWWFIHHQFEPRRTEVQIGNYLGALRRGGQLDMHNRFQR